MDQIKQANVGVVYRLIDQAGPVSRIDLSRLTQLVPASITKIVREMLRVRLVKETEIPASGHRGRPAVGLELDTGNWHYLVVRIAGGRMYFAIYDMRCQQQQAENYDLPAEGAQPLEFRILHAVEHFCRQGQYASQGIIAISVILPGVVDSESGIVRRMAYYPVRDMPLGTLLEQYTGVPVFVQHDISAWIMAETLSGASRGARDVVQMVIDDYVTACVISEGRLLHAGSGSLVEIGHIQFQPDGLLCHCGRHGCLETLISIDNVLLRLRQLLNQRPSLLHGRPVTCENVCGAALNGDALARQVIGEVAEHAGKALAIMVNLFNPQKILIASPFNRAATVFFPAITQSIYQQALSAYSQHLTVESTTFSGSDMVIGSARVKQAMYDGSLSMRLLQTNQRL